MSITNAYRITMVCYDPAGYAEDENELFISVVCERKGTSRDVAKRFGNKYNSVVCEHVSSADDGHISPVVADEIFAP